MKDFDLNLIPDRSLAVMTTECIEIDGPLSIADFKDTFGLIYKPTGHFIGFSKKNGLRLGTRPLRMVNGIWLMEEFRGNISGHEEVCLKPELLSLEFI